ncbi:MAG: hemolysin family protein [Candidatus Aminicenantaceae bacterium]
MNIELLISAGLVLSFLCTFLLSLFHIALSTSSKISISRFLEDKEKEYRLKVLKIYEEIKISVNFVRNLFLIAFLVYLFISFPRSKYWPLWLFIVSLALYLIFFDMIPHLLNSLYKKKVLTIFLPSFKLPYYLSAPLLLILKSLTPKKEIEEFHEATDEEIQTFIDEAKEEGIIEKDEGTLLKSIVEFGDTVVREIMTPRVDMICISKNATIQKLKGLVLKEKHSRIPVYRERVDNIEGIVIAKDFLKYSDDKHMNDSIEPLIRPSYFVPESMKVSELLKEFQRRKQKLAIVVDEHGGVSGLVTMEDLMEEIVGEIKDEYDKEQAQITKVSPFDYIVSGDVDVEEIEKLFDIDLAEDIYITVGGLIIHHLERFPELGERIKIKGLSLEILDVDQKRVKKLRIKKHKD